MSRSRHKRKPYGRSERGGTKPRTQIRREVMPTDRGLVTYAWAAETRNPRGDWVGSPWPDEVVERARVWIKRWKARSPGLHGGVNAWEAYLCGAPGPDLRDKVRALAGLLGWPSKLPEGQPRL